MSMRRGKRYPGEEVAEKMRFVKTAVDFAIAITSKDGKQHDQGIFSFRVRKDSSMMGGNTAEIWYRPESQNDGKIHLVLETWWQFDVEGCRIVTLDSNPRWQYELQGEIKRHKEVVARVSQIAVSAEKKLTKYEKEMRQQRFARKINGKYEP